MNTRSDSTPPCSAARGHESPVVARRRLYLVAAACLLVACGATGLLVLAHFKAVALPGCGADSGCGAAQASRWARVPGLGWPVSHLGAAYFATMLVVWIAAARDGLSIPLRWVVRGGAAVSIAYLVVLSIAPYWCNYCAIAHAANLGFLACVELGGRGPARSRRMADVGMGLAGMVGLTAILLIAETRFAAAVQVAAERDAADSTRRIVEEDAGARIALTTSKRVGADAAAARLVVFFDYQCLTCGDVEKQIVEVLERSDRVSVGFKHFPYNRDCNRSAGDVGHPNACWAARVAEAAAVLHGQDGFWIAHRWLFARMGGFERAELVAFLNEQGWDVAAFEEELRGARVAERIAADVEDGIRVGVTATPVVYVNGIELKGAHAEGQIGIAVDVVLESADAGAVSAGDFTLAADEKIIADWMSQPAEILQLGHAARTRGPEDAPLHIVLWADYRAGKVAVVDKYIRQRMVLQPQAIRYSVAHFPLEESCNPNQRTIYAGSCAMARFAEAAAHVGGLNAFWTIHAWLLENIGNHTNANLLAQIERTGMDPRAMHAMVSGPEVADAIEHDIAEAHRLGIDGVPMLVINGRRVPLFSVESTVRLDLFFDEIIGPAPTAPPPVGE